MNTEQLPTCGRFKELHVSKLKTINAGSCNFCSANNLYVYEISGDRLLVRMCDKCFKLICDKINDSSKS